MLTSWDECIFREIKDKLQDGAMKLVLKERCGEAFDSQLVIGVRESYGKGLLQAESMRRRGGLGELMLRTVQEWRE